jgi:hypothetical protein
MDSKTDTARNFHKTSAIIRLARAGLVKRDQVKSVLPKQVLTILKETRNAMHTVNRKVTAEPT